MHARNAIAAALFAASIAPVAACGTACPDIIKDFNDFNAGLESPVRSASKDPDARLRFPLTTANRLIHELLKARLGVKVALPPLTLGQGVSLPLPDLYWALTDVSMVARPDKRLGAAVTLELLDKAGPVVSFAIETRLQTVFEHAVRDLVTGARWTLRPDQIERIVPTVSDGGPKRLASWLGAQLPPPLRFLGEEALVESMLPQLLELATQDGWPTIRDQVLGTDALIDFAFEIPQTWGIAWASLEAIPARGKSGGALELAMWPKLSPEAAKSSRGAATLADGPNNDAPRIALSGPFTVHLIAAAQKRGELPARFDSAGNAAADGPWHVRTVWHDGRRPFGAYLWRFDDACRRIDLDATLKLAMDGNDLAVTVKDARVEGVKGPAFAEAFAWVERLFGAATDLTFRQATTMALDVGEATFTLKPTAVSHDARGIEADLAFTVTPRR